MRVYTKNNFCAFLIICEWKCIESYSRVFLRPFVEKLNVLATLIHNVLPASPSSVDLKISTAWRRVTEPPPPEDQ